MMNIREANFISIDLETTGLNQKKDEILAIGAVPILGTRIMAGESYYTLVRPSKFRIDTIRIHGLNPKELENAPNFSEIAEEVFRLIKGRIIVGYAVEIDYNFLKRAFKIEGYKLKNQTLDVIDLERAVCYILGERPISEMTLDNLAEKYGIKTPYRHNALADAFITAQIFQIQLLRSIKYGIKTIDKLFELIKRGEIDRQFGSHIF
ncbi:exonuclease domain-containing protein [Archaeoglobus sp. UBA230]|jgi:DNA polymerase-3 subunit epsilon|uniref:exonuclease domain-containing protein n=2 Tax=Archaeoglobus TaxID=2233 RepID=UPI0025C611D7|nr:exonuclease domain-containing protein [Archaeoglobus sp. UBA230]